MSKKILRPIFAIAAIAANFIPGVGQFISAGISIAGAILLKPSKAKPAAHATERLQASLDPNAPRKAWLGHTAGATDVRYQAYTGTNQEYLHQIMCCAAHPVEAIEELWFDSKLAWSAAGGVAADYAGYLQVDVRNPGTAANGIAIDAVWTAQCTLTGCAYLRIRYKLTGNTKSAESPFASGIPSRVTIRGKGAKVPDIRIPGVDINDQATWVYSSAGSDSGRNPALQRLFYLVGWRINGKLSVGRGVPPTRIDLAAHITAANLSDEAVALEAGGTEPRYRSDILVSEGEDPGNVLGLINQSMNAVATDDGGKLGVVILHDDLSDPDILELSDDDLAGQPEESWRPFAAIQDTLNLVRGQYTDASDAGLYQLVDAREVTLPGADYGSIDGIQRVDSFPLANVQSGTQWNRLAVLRLNRTQWPGIYEATFKDKAAAARMWKPVIFSHRGLPGFGGKVFRVVGQRLAIGSGGWTRLTLREESSAIYGLPAQHPVILPVRPPPWDPANDPLRRGIVDASATADWPAVTDSLGTRPDDNSDVTAANTAAAIAGQGALATASAAAWGSQVTGRPTELTDGRVAAGLDAAGDLGRNIGTARLNTSNVLRWTGGALYAGELTADVTSTHVASAISGQGALATASAAAWGSQVTGRPTELTDGRVAAGLDAAGDLGRNIGTARLNSSNVLRWTGGALYAGELTADVTSTHVASSIAGQGSLATASAAAWGSQVTDRPAELTDGRIAAGLDVAGDLARNIGSGRANTSNLLRYTAGALYTGELAADVTSTHVASAISGQGSLATASSAAWGSQVSGRPTELTDGRVAAGLDAAGDLGRNIGTARLNTSNVLRWTGGALYAGELTADVTSTHVASAISGQGALATLSSVAAANVSFAIGGGNRLRNSSFTMLGGGIAGLGAGFSPYNNDANPITCSQVTGRLEGMAQRVAWAANTSTKGVYLDNATVDNTNIWQQGHSYIWSMWAKASGAAIGQTLETNWNHIPTSITYLSNPALSAAWQRYVFLIVWGAAATLDVNGFVSVASTTANGVSSIDFDDMQIEEGDLVTSYAPRADELLSGVVTYNYLSNSAARLGVNVVRNDGSTSFTDAIGVTSLGTASAIAGQGSLATASAAAWGSQVSGRPTELTDGRVAAGLDAAGDLGRNIGTARLNSSNVLRWTGGALYAGELTADVTSTHTASAIAGQGTLATLSTADWKTNVSGVGKPSNDAGTANIFVPIGSYSSIAGNTQKKTGGTHGAYEGGIRGAAQDGSAYISCRPITYDSTGALVTGGWTTNLVLDASATNLNPGAAKWWALVTDTGGTSSIDLYKNNTNVASITVGAGLTANSELRLSYRGSFVVFTLDGVPPNSNFIQAEVSGLTFYPKIIDFYLTGSNGSSVRDINYGSYPIQPIFGANGTVLRETGAAVTDASAITALGVASAIAGQGALATKSTASMDSDVVDGSTYVRPKATEFTAGVPKLSVAGSGKRLADPRNLPPITAMNAGYKFTGAVTYTAAAGTPATATISVAAGSALIGSSSVSYSAMSVGVSGTGGTTVSYYLYVDDLTFAGGAQTLVATTTANDVYSNDARVLIGYVDVIFPTSGTGGGSGGGGSGWCLEADEMVETQNRGWIPARDVVEGDVLKVLALDMEGTDWHPCEGNQLAWADGWRLFSATGISVSVSETTPITVRHGPPIRPVDVCGQALPVEDEAGFRWEACWSERVGAIEVAKILCGQRTYSAGHVAGRAILTHNPKP